MQQQQQRAGERGTAGRSRRSASQEGPQRAHRTEGLCGELTTTSLGGLAPPIRASASSRWKAGEPSGALQGAPSDGWVGEWAGQQGGQTGGWVGHRALERAA